MQRTPGGESGGSFAQTVGTAMLRAMSSSSSQPTSGPTPRQLRYLVRLALKTGMTFIKAATPAAASIQITLLQAEAARQRKTQHRTKTATGAASEASARRHLSRNARLINATRGTSKRT